MVDDFIHLLPSSFTLISSLEWQWKTFILLSAAPSVMLLLLFPWMIESPRLHLKAKQEKRAVQTLQLIAKKNHLEPFPEGLKLKGLPEEESKKRQWLAIFSRKYALSTFILTFLWFLNMGAYYGICFVTPLYFKALHDNEYLAVS